MRYSDLGLHSGYGYFWRPKIQPPNEICEDPPPRMRTLPNNTFRVARTGHIRGFASSIPRRGPIEITAQLIHSIHDLSGLTYGAAIPLTAIAFRSIVTLPLSIYSQKKLSRRIELRPLFHQWGDIIGIQAVARAKANNVDLRGNQEAHANMMTTVQMMVMSFTFEALTIGSCREE